MAKWARSKMLNLRLAEEKTFNVEKFLQGTLEISSHSRLLAYSALVAADVELKPEELPWLLSLPEEDRIESERPPGPDAPSPERLHELIAQGVVIVDAERDEPWPETAHQLADRYARLEALQWHPTALQGHLVNQDEEHAAAGRSKPLDLKAKMADYRGSAETFVDNHGEPPPAFFDGPDPSAPLVPLADGLRQGPLYDVLARRRTLRAFDSGRALDAQRFAVLLRQVFGCHGRHTLSPRFFSLHKSSPSGGSLHPVEAYPVIRDVEGFEPGFYFYDARRHALRLLNAMAPEPLRQQMSRLAQGQLFAAEAHFTVILVARFERNFWKYRRRLNTFNVVLKDAGHLSQTFQLVATDLNLAPFYTGAIDPLTILDVLGFKNTEDRFEHGPIGILGAGIHDPDDSTRMPLEPYDPLTRR